MFEAKKVKDNYNWETLINIIVYTKFLIGIPNIIKMLILPILFYGFIAIQIKILTLLAKFDNFIL